MTDQPAAVCRRPIVGVLGSGEREHRELAEPLGAWLARLGVHLLTGGGAGVMTAVGRGFAGVADRQGLVLGVIPGEVSGDRYTPFDGYPNPWVEVAIFTHLPLGGIRGTDPMSRNHINVLSADVLVALPGGAGTRSEIELAEWYGRPLIACLGPDGTRADLPRGVPVARTLEEVQQFVVQTLGVRIREPEP